MVFKYETYTLCSLIKLLLSLVLFFFFNDTATTEIYTLSLHDALPIFLQAAATPRRCWRTSCTLQRRSEEHTSELQSRRDLVCRLLLEKNKHTNSSVRPVITQLRDLTATTL